MRYQHIRTCCAINADRPLTCPGNGFPDSPGDDGDDLAGQAIDLIVANACPLTPGQREALRRLILGGGAR